MKFAIALFSLLASVVLAADQPNVIVLLTDDQGYGDLSCNGNPLIQTPHLDQLHAQSARLTDFHVAPMCTPTRGQLLTGRDAARNGAINVSSGRTLLRAELPTLADVYAEAGYRTGIFGKWHLGDTYPYRPQDRGFETVLWFPSSHINSTPDVWDNDYFDDTYRTNDGLKAHQGYCTDVFFREAMSWMKQRADADQPFFLYLPTNAPHTPYWLPQDYTDAMAKRWAEVEAAGGFSKKLPPQKKADIIDFLAMIQNIDDNFGKLDAFLKQHDLFDNTIVVFLTDNGSTQGADYYNAGMWGKKTTLWEGGHRVPCFVRYPAGGLSEGRDIDGLTQVQDLFPTLLDLSAIESEATVDGLNLAPILRGEDEVPEDRMLIINYSRMPIGFEFAAPDSPSIMRREGAGVLWKRWRLLEDRELYDLEKDTLQRSNVIDQHPEVVAQMRAHLDAWWAEVKASANEPQPVVIGHPAENPVLLTACEWLDVFIDQQKQIRRADLKNGWWELEVAEAGTYQFELRRWPSDLPMPIRAGIAATKVTDGILDPGVVLPITRARLKVGTGPTLIQPVQATDQSITFTVDLKPGPTRLYTWFDDANRQTVVGAYYVHVTRLE